MAALPPVIAEALAGLAVAGVVWGWTFLATVDWIHPHTRPSGYPPRTHRSPT